MPVARHRRAYAVVSAGRIPATAQRVGHPQSTETKPHFKNLLQVSGQAIPVGDPMADPILAQQPKADFLAFQRASLKAQARAQFG